MSVVQLRKRPVDVQAVRWTGDNEAELTGSVFDDLHSTWVGVKTGQWIIRGVKGEFYPCDPEVLAETYEVLS